MAFIKVVSPHNASGRLARVYRLVQSADGQVNNVLQVRSLRPHTLEGHMAIYKAASHNSLLRSGSFGG